MPRVQEENDVQRPAPGGDKGIGKPGKTQSSWRKEKGRTRQRGRSSHPYLTRPLSGRRDSCSPAEPALTLWCPAAKLRSQGVASDRLTWPGRGASWRLQNRGSVRYRAGGSTPVHTYPTSGTGRRPVVWRGRCRTARQCLRLFLDVSTQRPASRPHCHLGRPKGGLVAAKVRPGCDHPLICQWPRIGF